MSAFLPVREQSLSAVLASMAAACPAGCAPGLSGGQREVSCPRRNAKRPRILGIRGLGGQGGKPCSGCRGGWLVEGESAAVPRKGAAYSGGVCPRALRSASLLEKRDREVWGRGGWKGMAEGVVLSGGAASRGNGTRRTPKGFQVFRRSMVRAGVPYMWPATGAFGLGEEGADAFRRPPRPRGGFRKLGLHEGPVPRGAEGFREGGEKERCMECLDSPCAGECLRPAGAGSGRWGFGGGRRTKGQTRRPPQGRKHGPPDFGSARQGAVRWPPGGWHGVAWRRTRSCLPFSNDRAKVC